jgi:hypothetical protein
MRLRAPSKSFKIYPGFLLELDNEAERGQVLADYVELDEIHHSAKRAKVRRVGLDILLHRFILSLFAATKLNFRSSTPPFASTTNLQHFPLNGGELAVSDITG